MRLIFDAQDAGRNRLLNKLFGATHASFLTGGNRWTMLSVQFKRLNGEFTSTQLIDLLQTLEFSWDDPNSFIPRPESQGNARAWQNRARRPSPLLRNLSPEPRAT